MKGQAVLSWSLGPEAAWGRTNPCPFQTTQENSNWKTELNQWFEDSTFLGGKPRIKLERFWKAVGVRLVMRRFQKNQAADVAATGSLRQVRAYLL